MSDKIYKLNEAIKVVFQALGGQTGITDLSMVVTDPDGNDSSPVTMTELSNGLYEKEFTPDEIGRWWIEITSTSYPENGSKTSYVVGYQEGADNIVIIDTDGNPSTTDFSTESTSKEIRDTVGQESGKTVLSLLQSIWDAIYDAFSDGLAKVKIWDGTNIAGVTATGRLKVDTSPPAPPPATTPVDIDEYSNVSSSATNIFVIPSGEILYMTVFNAGAEVDTTAGSVIELWYDPLGTGVGMILIDTIFASGNSDQHDLNVFYTGDGSRAIRLIRKRLTGGAKWIQGGWEGYY